MVKITRLDARQVFDSRGNPTVEAEIFLSNGGRGHFITPSGASVGKKEALELRDGDISTYAGRGVLTAVGHILGEISTCLLAHNIRDQDHLDQLLIELDGTERKSRLGANAILAVSGAFFHACAKAVDKPLYRILDLDEYLLPMPLVNVINGGAHANNGLDIQEFMVVPARATSFSEAMATVAELFYALKKLLETKGLSSGVGDEGGFAPKLNSNEEALDLLVEATIKAGLKIGQDIKFALDIAGSEIFNHEQQKYHVNGALKDRYDFLAWIEKLVANYPIVSLEDPFHEDDIEGFQAIMNRLGGWVQIVGDDIFVTSSKYIKNGVDGHYANAVLIKMNQIGTITETMKAVGVAKNGGLSAIISHRSGDSEDTTIADLAVLTKAGQIKTGSLCRSERTAKYNRLLRIEAELGKAAKFVSWYR